MTPRLSGQTSILGGVFFVYQSLVEIEGQEKTLTIFNLVLKAGGNLDMLNVAYSYTFSTFSVILSISTFLSPESEQK